MGWNDTRKIRGRLERSKLGWNDAERLGTILLSMSFPCIFTGTAAGTEEAFGLPIPVRSARSRTYMEERWNGSACKRHNSHRLPQVFKANGAVDVTSIATKSTPTPLGVFVGRQNDPSTGVGLNFSQPQIHAPKEKNQWRDVNCPTRWP